jgi:hypothetical protein
VVARNNIATNTATGAEGRRGFIEASLTRSSGGMIRRYVRERVG